MPAQVAIVGGSLAGLAAANVFYRLGYLVHVYEKSATALDNRGSSLGFVDIPLWEHIRGAPMMRFGQRANRGQGAYFYGDLWKFLFDGLPDGTVRFGRTIEDFGEDLMKPSIDGNVYDTVIVADGGFSTLRKFVNGYDKKPEYAGHMIYRVKLDNREFPEFNAEGGYTEGRAFIMLLKVAPSDGSKWLMGGVAVPVPESEVTRPQDGANRQDLVATQSVPDWFMPYVRKTFARSGGGQVVRWLELAAEKGKITPQPLFEFAADRVTAGRLILVGDAAHMASPRTAVGAHTGVLDAAGLLEAFGKYGSAIDQAIGAYAPGGLKRAKDLCARSKEVSKPLVYTPEGDDRRSEL